MFRCIHFNSRLHIDKTVRLNKRQFQNSVTIHILQLSEAVAVPNRFQNKIGDYNVTTGRNKSL